MRVFIVNGDKHVVFVQGPDGAKVAPDQEMNRGREYSVQFTPAKAGVYQFVCATHAPTMTSTILVLPRS